VRIEVEVQQILQSMKTVSREIYLYLHRLQAWRDDERGEVRHTHSGRRYGGETDPICVATRAKFVRGLCRISVNGHVVESKKMLERICPEARSHEAPESRARIALPRSRYGRSAGPFWWEELGAVGSRV
jgi:hypothetical protein